jgi:glycosyltransferase involved in cell wall biosynthesis
MNILVVTAYPPVLQRHGGGVRMYHNIRILSEKHAVHVLSFLGIDEDPGLLDPVRKICASVRGIPRIPDFRPHWFSLLPFMVREFSTPEMHDAVDGILRARKIDVLQCEYLQMAQFRRDGVFSVLTAHEAVSKNAHDAFETESDPLEKLRLFYRWMQMLHYEVAQIRKFDRVVAMTEADASYLKEYAPEANVRAVPIGIDVEEFTPEAPESSGKISVLFVGNFLHSPNVEAADFIETRIAPRFPEVQFVIAGYSGAAAAPGVSNVERRGYVPRMQALYRSPDTIVMAPLFKGTGQRVKLLEAFAMGCPVVTTPLGAAGFPVRDGVEAKICQTAEQFCSALKQLIENRDLRRRMGQAARQMILDRFSWNRIGEDLLGVVSEAAVAH